MNYENCNKNTPCSNNSCSCNSNPRKDMNCPNTNGIKRCTRGNMIPNNCGRSNMMPTNCNGNMKHNPCHCQMPTNNHCNHHNHTDGCDIGNDHVDKMEVAMAYVPWQKWDNIFPMDEGFVHGTIFMDLCKPYCGRGMK